MSRSPESIFDKALQHAWQWIDELIEQLDDADARGAYRVLRATLHTLRDRITVNEAVDLGAQLPMLIRGLYYEGYRPASTPHKLRTKRAFLDAVGRELEDRDPDPEEATRAVFDVLSRHISGSEIQQVRHMLPAEIAELWRPE